MEQDWSKQRIETVLPELSGRAYKVTSDADRKCNCAAWAAGLRTWFDINRYWPLADRTDGSVGGYQRAFETLGFVECPTPDLEAGYEKIVLYEYKGDFSHAARQLPNGAWTSKLGKLHDIEHEAHDTLDGARDYGRVASFMKRPRS